MISALVAGGGGGGSISIAQRMAITHGMAQ